MKIRRLFFREMGTYSDIYSRPYATDVSGRVLSQFDEITRGGQDIQPTVLSGLATRILRPTSDVSLENRIQIANGWGTKRFMFIMEAEVHRSSTTVTVEVITGYTDHDDRFTRSGSIDPDTVLYFNSAFTLRTMEVLGGRGRQEQSLIQDSIQIVSRRTMADYGRHSRSVGTVTMRPEDLFIAQTRLPEFEELSNDEGYRDMRTAMERPLKASRRENTISANYLCKSVAAYRDSGETDFLGDEDIDQRLISARGRVKEPLLQQRRAFEQLARETQIMESGMVTYGELLAMNPDLDRIAEISFNDPRVSIDYRSQSAEWNGRNSESIAATIIAHAIPNLLMECMYSSATIVSTNMTRSGQFESTVPMLHPFAAGGDIDENYNRLISKINHELMPGLVLNEYMTVDVSIRSAIYGDTVIDISLDGKPHEHFVFPSFCDSLATPVIADDQHHLYTLAQDIIGITDQLGHIDHSPAPQPTIYQGHGYGGGRRRGGGNPGGHYL